MTFIPHVDNAFIKSAPTIIQSNKKLLKEKQEREKGDTVDTRVLRSAVDDLAKTVYSVGHQWMLGPRGRGNMTVFKVFL